MLFYPVKCFAAWSEDSDARRNCASGGIATAMGRYMIEVHGGVVYGAAYDEDMTPVLRRAETVGDLEAFKGSKYVQSILSHETVQEIKELLEAGRKVLFVGLPCQVEALTSSVETGRENLVAVDLLCHGVVPVRLFKDELDYLSKRHGWAHVSDVRFREPSGFRMSIWDGDELLYSKAADKQPYFSAFLWGLGLKESCYSCRFSRPERTGDITLGDFIGLDVPNASVVTANNPAAVLFLMDMFQHDRSLYYEVHDYYTRLQYAPSVRENTKRHPQDAKFRELLDSVGYARAVRRILRPIYVKRAVNRAYVKAKRAVGIKGSILPGRK